MKSNCLRVLLTDDSAVIRRMVTEAITSDVEIEVVGAARNGAEAIEMLKVRKPDIMVLDVEMPVMDGVETVSAVRKMDPHLPIIMFSSITTQGGMATLDALAVGANDYVTKPSGLGHANDALNYIRGELIPKIKHWGRRHQIRTSTFLKSAFPGSGHSSAPVHDTAKPSVPRIETTGAPVGSRSTVAVAPVDIVAIGVSTGGPDTLSQILSRIPGDFPVPIVIVQHMPAIFTRLLAERLDAACPLNVREGCDGANLQAGDIWIAPGNFHMSVRQQQAQRVLQITQGSQENSCRPSVDPLFRSVAAVYGQRSLGVILTGMGCDGTAGCRAIRDIGGRVIVQDEASSVVWGMPGAVAHAGLADEILNPSQISQQIVDRARRNPVRSPMALAGSAVTGRFDSKVTHQFRET